MKKLLDLGSLALIVAALILIGYLNLPQAPANVADSTGKFKDFPVGQARLINLAARREALEDLSPREQLDQMRDWLLFTAASSAGLSAEGINQSLFDLPPIRHGYMQPVANFEYDDSRSCFIGNGQVLALVPAKAPDERHDRLAKIADEQRKNLGLAPAKLMIFEYELKPADDPARQTALLTRREPVEVKDLFSTAAGYYEAKINNLDDLKRFMGQVDDLTFVSVKDGLTVGGRKVKGHNYRGIRVEEIAALYQSEAKIRGGRNAVKQKIDDFNARWAKRTYHGEAEKKELEDEYARAEAALKEELRDARKDGGLVGSSGFSLDPTYDYQNLAAKFDSSIAPGMRRILGGTSEQKIGEAREALSRNDANPLFELLGEVASTGPGGETLARLIEEGINKDYGFQAARYDGELKGTEAGMVLFYTDLLAKLWAIDYQKSAPSGNIAEFRPMTALHVSSAYKRELELLSNTRLWFGPQTKGYQLADNGQSMLFGRVATRVYAASSNSLKPGVESPANAESAAFLGWWDNHYDEISRFEPEYERLNQIMKWSLVVTWLNQKEQANKFGFLQNVPVERSNWFPDWVKQHPQLRYTAWDKINFYQPGYNGSTTEAMPRLRSETYRRFGYNAWLIGGVSLASEETFAGRAALSPETKIAPSALRSNLILGESTTSNLKTFEGTSFSFLNKSPDSAVTTATAKSGTRMRGLYGEVANEPVERVVTHGNGGLNIGTRIGDVSLGDLTIGNAENGFRVGWASRDMDAGAALARRLSLSREPGKALALDHSVKAAIKLPGDGVYDGGYLVKLEGSDRWLKAVPERGPSANLESGYTARVGDFDANAKNYNLAWVKPEEVSARLRESGALRFQKVTDSRYQMELGTFDPAGTEISIEGEGLAVRGQLNRETGEVSFASDRLPQAVRDDPSILRRLVAEAKPSAAGGSRYVVGPANKSGLIEQLSNGNYRAAVRELVKAPDEFKAQLEANLSASLGDCKELMRSREFEALNRRVDELIQIYGPRDELRLHKVVADLNNVPGATRNGLADLLTQGNRPSMLDELSARLNGDLTLRNGEGISLARQGDDLAVRYDMQGLNDGAPLARGEPGQMKALIYVEDTPGLNNLDWQVSPERTLDAAISGEFKARVIKLPRGDVARFRPALIYDKSDGVTFKAVNPSGIGSGLRRPRYFAGTGHPGRYPGGGFVPHSYSRMIVPCSDDDNNQDECDDENKDAVIVIVRK